MLNNATGFKKIYIATSFTDLRCGTGAFSWPRSVDEAMLITEYQYHLLMEGFDIIAKHPIEEIDASCNT